MEYLRRARLAETPVETRDDVRGILHQADLAHRGEYRSAIGVVTDLLDERWDQRIPCIGGRFGIGVSRRSSVTDTFGDVLEGLGRLLLSQIETIGKGGREGKSGG